MLGVLRFPGFDNGFYIKCQKNKHPKWILPFEPLIDGPTSGVCPRLHVARSGDFQLQLVSLTSVLECGLLFSAAF